MHHPYDDFETSVARFVEQAAADPDVLAIRQTLYRTSGESPIVPALMHAAERGKQTVCLVELQARFDEERNIQWSRAMERTGVHVVYGNVGRKIHAKIALVVRREGKRLVRYVHVGTGNYHPATARLYTDIGLFTCNEDITEDVADLFNYLTGFSQHPCSASVLVAPDRARARTASTRSIRSSRSIAPACPAGSYGSSTRSSTAEVIRALYRASPRECPSTCSSAASADSAPGCPESATNDPRALDRGSLPRARADLCFPAATTRATSIGSADMMARNLDERVELLTPVEDATARGELMQVLELMLADTALAWRLDPDGNWTRIEPAPGDAPLNSQESLMERARRRHR